MSKSYTAYVRRELGPPQRIEARSYSTPREILSNFGNEIDAYIEWGGPVQFDRPNDEPNDDHSGGDERKRYTFTEEARRFRHSTIDTVTTDGSITEQGDNESVVHSWAMGGPNDVQHRFYLNLQPHSYAKFSGHSPVIPVPALDPFANPYDYIPFEDVS